MALAQHRRHHAPPQSAKYASLAHGAQFVEVKVDPDLGQVRVTRAVEVTACGKILNPKASHSQEIGGVVWGIGMALQEARRASKTAVGFIQTSRWISSLSADVPPTGRWHVLAAFTMAKGRENALRITPW